MVHPLGLALAQVLAFPLAPTPAFDWATSSATRGLSKFFGYTVLMPWSLGTPALVRVVTLAALAGMAAVIALTATVLLLLATRGAVIRPLLVV